MNAPIELPTPRPKDLLLAAPLAALESATRAEPPPSEAPRDGRPAEEQRRAAASVRGVEVLRARFEALAPAVRRVLKAASLFGHEFTLAGVSALLGDDALSLQESVRGLAALEQLGLVARRAPSGAPQATDYRFRDPLARDLAYASSSEIDRVLGHELAAEHLRGTGAEPAAIAPHLSACGRTRAAVRAYLAGAELACTRGDLSSADELASRGLALGAEREPCDRLLAIRARAGCVARETAAIVVCDADEAPATLRSARS